MPQRKKLIKKKLKVLVRTAFSNVALVSVSPQQYLGATEAMIYRSPRALAKNVAPHLGLRVIVYFQPCRGGLIMPRVSCRYLDSSTCYVSICSCVCVRASQQYVSGTSDSIPTLFFWGPVYQVCTACFHKRKAKVGRENLKGKKRGKASRLTFPVEMKPIYNGHCPDRTWSTSYGNTRCKSVRRLDLL